MQTTIIGRRGVLALLLMLAVGVLALVAATASTSAAGVEIESATAEHALPPAANSATPDHCGGAGDLALIQATDVGIPSLQSMPMASPGIGFCYVQWYRECLYRDSFGVCWAWHSWAELICV